VEKHDEVWRCLPYFGGIKHEHFKSVEISDTLTHKLRQSKN